MYAPARARQSPACGLPPFGQRRTMAPLALLTASPATPGKGASMKPVIIAVVCLLAVGAPAVAADAKRPMKVEDLFRFQRVSDSRISPDGKLVAYVVATVDLPGNSTASTIWLAPTDGGEPRQLTNTTK